MNIALKRRVFARAQHPLTQEASMTEAPDTAAPEEAPEQDTDDDDNGDDTGTAEGE